MSKKANLKRGERVAKGRKKDGIVGIDQTKFLRVVVAFDSESAPTWGNSIKYDWNSTMTLQMARRYLFSSSYTYMFCIQLVIAHYCTTTGSTLQISPVLPVCPS